VRTPFLGTPSTRPINQRKCLTVLLLLNSLKELNIKEKLKKKKKKKRRGLLIFYFFFLFMNYRGKFVFFF